MPEILQHWIDTWSKAYKDAGNIIPKRSQFGLRDIGKYSPHFALLEMCDDNVIRVKNSGSAFDELWGRNVVSEGLEAFSTEKSFNKLDGYFRTQFHFPCGGHVCEIIINPKGKKTWMESLYFPCTDDEGNIKYLMSLGHYTNDGHEFPLDESFLKVVQREFVFCTYLDLGFGAPEVIPMKSVDDVIEEYDKKLLARLKLYR